MRDAQSDPAKITVGGLRTVGAPHAEPANADEEMPIGG